MGDRTGISWTDATWNPVRGCSRVSEGCRHCYAEAVAARFSGPGQPYEGLARRRSNGEPTWTGKVRLVPEHLEDPLRWRRPRKIFVNSMSDLFHEGLEDHEIAEVWRVMLNAHRHTFQVLTKRPARMLQWCRERLSEDLQDEPPRHIWLGVSVEDQDAANERIPLLLATPAAVRFISAEPLLGPLELTRLRPQGVTWRDVLEGREHAGLGVFRGLPHLDWVIVGGESGRDYRPMDFRWVEQIKRDCDAAGVAYFFKQRSSSRPGAIDGVPPELLVQAFPR